MSNRKEIHVSYNYIEGEAVNQTDDGKLLQVKLAILSGDYQFLTTALFGLFAGAIAAWAFGSQLLVDNYMKPLGIEFVLSIAVYLLAILSSYGIFKAVTKLKDCRDKMIALEVLYSSQQTKSNMDAHQPQR